MCAFSLWLTVTKANKCNICGDILTPAHAKCCSTKSDSIDHAVPKMWRCISRSYRETEAPIKYTPVQSVKWWWKEAITLTCHSYYFSLFPLQILIHKGQSTMTNLGNSHTGISGAVKWVRNAAAVNFSQVLSFVLIIISLTEGKLS